MGELQPRRAAHGTGQCAVRPADRGVGPRRECGARAQGGRSMTDRRVSVALFVLTFIAYAWFFNGGGWNQNAQFDLARALVERQTLHIDGYRVNTGDISWSAVSGEWHAYINKPPGVSFLAA